MFESDEITRNHNIYAIRSVFLLSMSLARLPQLVHVDEFDVLPLSCMYLFKTADVASAGHTKATERAAVVPVKAGIRL